MLSVHSRVKQVTENACHPHLELLCRNAKELRSVRSCVKHKAAISAVSMATRDILEKGEPISIATRDILKKGVPIRSMHMLSAQLIHWVRAVEL